MADQELIPAGAELRPIQESGSATSPTSGQSGSTGQQTASNGTSGELIPQGARLEDPIPEWSTTQALTGPGTALGAPMPDAWQKEAEGFHDLMYTNIKKGLDEITSVETPHIVQGSPIEKVIQTFNPNFHGGISKPAADAANANLYAPIANPAVNVSQFIDKQQHPMIKAIAEAAEGLTSPENMSILASTGGFGLIESPKQLVMANRLLSLGFSAQAVGSLYKNAKGFKEAFDNGDVAQAEYLLTHSVLSGAMAVMSGHHAATGESLPVFGDLEKNAVKGIAGKVLSSLNPLSKEETQTLTDKATAVGLVPKAVIDAYQKVKSGTSVHDVMDDLVAKTRNVAGNATEAVGKGVVSGAAAVGKGIANYGIEQLAAKIRGDQPEANPEMNDLADMFNKADQARKTGVGKSAVAAVTGVVGGTISVISSLIGANRPEARTAQATNLAHAAEFEVPLSVGQSSGIKGIQNIEGLLKSLPIINAPFAKLEAAQTTGLRNAANTVADGMFHAATTEWNPTLRGAAIQQAFQDTKTFVSNSLDTSLDGLLKLNPGAQVDITPIRAFASEALEDIKTTPGALSFEPKGMAETRAILNSFTDPAVKSTLGLKEAAILDRNLIDKIFDLQPGAGRTKLVELEQKLKAVIGPVGGNDFLHASNNYRDTTEALHDSVVSKMVHEEQPQVVASYLVNNGSPTLMNMVKQAALGHAENAMPGAASLMSDTSQLASIQRAVAGEIFHSVLDKNDGVLSGKGLNTIWNQFGGFESAKALYGTEGAHRMQDLIDLAKTVDLNPNAADHTLLKAGEFVGIGLEMYKYGLHSPTTAMIGGAAAIAYVFSELLTRQAGQNLLNRFLGGDVSAGNDISRFAATAWSKRPPNPGSSGTPPAGAPSGPTGGNGPTGGGSNGGDNAGNNPQPFTGGDLALNFGKGRVAGWINQKLFGNQWGGENADKMEQILNSGAKTLGDQDKDEFGKYLVATHEAVHAAAYKAMGIPVDSATVVPTLSTKGEVKAGGDFFKGITDVHDPRVLDIIAKRQAAAMAPTIYLKSRLGGPLLSRAQLDHLTGAQGDFNNIRTIRDGINQEYSTAEKASINKKLAAYIQTFNTPEFEKTVGAIAKELHENGTASGKRISDILNNPDNLIRMINRDEAPAFENGIADEKAEANEKANPAINPPPKSTTLMSEFGDVKANIIGTDNARQARAEELLLKLSQEIPKDESLFQQVQRALRAKYRN